VGSDIPHNSARFTLSWKPPADTDVAGYHAGIGEPRLEPPYEPNPIRLDPERCSYEVLCAHMFDEVLGVQPETRSEQIAMRALLLGIYAVMGIRENTLSKQEEEEWRR